MICLLSTANLRNNRIGLRGESGGKHMIVIRTGDKDLLALGQFRAVRIVTARVFVMEFLPGSSK